MRTCSNTIDNFLLQDHHVLRRVVSLPLVPDAMILERGMPSYLITAHSKEKEYLACILHYGKFTNFTKMPVFWAIGVFKGVNSL